MKVRNIIPLQSWLTDLKSGKLISHQPKRKSSHSAWYVKEAAKEGRTLK